MYRMSEYEFMQYEMAQRQLEELRANHKVELQQAYDDIHPTRTSSDYHTGRIFSESINPADYAIYLVDMQVEHARIEKWWSTRVEVYLKALRMLSDEETAILIDYHYRSFENRQRVREVLKKHIEMIVSTKTELQRQSIPLDDIEDLEEVDRRIEQMSMDELMKDYWDQDEVG